MIHAFAMMVRYWRRSQNHYIPENTFRGLVPSLCWSGGRSGSQLSCGNIEIEHKSQRPMSNISNSRRATLPGNKGKSGCLRSSA